MSPKANKYLKTIIQLIIFVGLGVWIVYHMSQQMSAEEKAAMVASIKETRVFFLIPIFIAGIFSHVFRALRWKLLMEPIGIRPRTNNTILAVFIGYLGNLFLPRMGEVAKCTILAKYENAPADKLVGTIVIERLFDMVCLALIVGLTLLLEYDVIGAYAQDKFSVLFGNATLLILSVIIGIIGIIGVLFVIRKYPNNKLSKIAKGVVEGVSSIMKLDKRGLFLLYSVGIWFLYWFQLVLGFWSMPDVAHLGLSTALVVLVFGSIGMIVTQGGIGAYTYLIAEILLFYGIAKSAGVAFGWLSWSVQTGIILLAGIFSLILLPVVNRHARKGTMVSSKD